jgi:hypothetical protein
VHDYKHLRLKLEWLNDLAFRGTDGVLHLLDSITSKDVMKLYGPTIKFTGTYGGSEIKSRTLVKNDVKMEMDDLISIFNILQKKLSTLK